MIGLKNRNSKITEWEVNEEESLSDHREIRFYYITNNTTLDVDTRIFLNKLNWLKHRSLLGQELYRITPNRVHKKGVEEAMCTVTEMTQKCCEPALNGNRCTLDRKGKRRDPGGPLKYRL